MSAPSQIATNQDFNATVDAIWAVRRAAAYEAATYKPTSPTPEKSA